MHPAHRAAEVLHRGHEGRETWRRGAHREVKIVRLELRLDGLAPQAECAGPLPLVLHQASLLQLGAHRRQDGAHLGLGLG